MSARLFARMSVFVGLLACAAALPTVASAAPVLTSATATPAVTLTVKAPIAVRAKKALTVKGTASAIASAGETVTVEFDRKTDGWHGMASIVATLSASRGYSAKYAPAQTGQWRVVVSMEATGAHAAASKTRRFKAVGAKVIALTFDDGPWPTSTAKVVSALAKGDAQATFFELGSQVGSRSALSKSIIAGGNIIGVHSWDHALMTKRSAAVNLADLKKCIRTLKADVSITPTWFRPPYGATNATLKATAKKAGLKQVIWSVDTLDWKYRDTNSIVSRAMSGARDGAIVLMHDGGGPRAATDAAVPIVIRRLRAKGYSFVTLDEMAALGYKVR